LQSITGRQGLACRHIILLALSLKFHIAKNCRQQQPPSHLRPPPRGTPASIRIYLILPQTRVIGLQFCRRQCSIFIQICAVASKRSILSATECFLAVQRRTRLSKVDDFGTNQSAYDFLLVDHCNYGPILHRFRDMVTYWLKLPIFSTPLSFGTLAAHVSFGISH